MKSHFNKAVSPHTCNCTEKNAITAFSSAYSYLNIFAPCFNLVEPFIFDLSLGFRTDQYLLNSPSYLNS